MTLQRYGPSEPTVQAPEARSGARTAVKSAVAAVLVSGGVVGGGIVGVLAFFEYTGCFLGCSDANPEGGVLLGLLALVLLVAGPALAVVMWRTARTWSRVKVWAGIALGGPALYLGVGLGQSAIGF